MTAANSRMTFGAVLATVQTTANTLTNTVSAVNSAVGMVNKFVTDAADRQAVRSKLDTAIFEKTLHQEKAQELAISRLTQKEFMKQSADHAEMYQAAYEELGLILTPSK